jgi:hypothetical protein
MKDTALYEVLDCAVQQDRSEPLVDVEQAVGIGTQQLWQRMVIMAALTALAVALITGSLIVLRSATRSTVALESTGTTTTSQTSGAVVSAATTTASTATSHSGTLQESTLTAIRVSPAEASVDVDKTVRLSVIGGYSDGSERTITESVTWESANPQIATVDATGLVSAVGVDPATNAGHVEIWARIGGQSASAVITTAKPRILTGITITAPTSQDCTSGLSLTATGTYSDGSTEDITNRAQWSSTNPYIQVESGRVIWAENGTSSASGQVPRTQGGYTRMPLLIVDAQVSATLESQTGLADVRCARPVSLETTTTSADATTPSAAPPRAPATTPTPPTTTVTTAGDGLH